MVVSKTVRLDDQNCPPCPLMTISLSGQQPVFSEADTVLHKRGCVTAEMGGRAAYEGPSGQDPAELFRLCVAPTEADRTRGFTDDVKLLPESKARALVHRDGDWHRSVHLWLYHAQSRSVIQPATDSDIHSLTGAYPAPGNAGGASKAQ